MNKRDELKFKKKMSDFAEKKLRIWYENVRAEIPGTGKYTVSGKLKEDLIERLERIYSYIARNVLPESMVNSKSNTVKNVVAKIRSVILTIYTGRKKQQASYIIDSAEKIANKYIREAESVLRENNQTVTASSIRLYARRWSKQEYLNKIPGDAITETNWMVEAVKRYHVKTSSEKIEQLINKITIKLAVINSKNKEEDGGEELAAIALLSMYSIRKSAEENSKAVRKYRDQAIDAVNDMENIGETGTAASEKFAASILSLQRIAEKVKKKIKQWQDMGDGKVRSTHQFVSGKKKKFDEPFLVGAYEMMYPGDSSLGAGPEEIVNCRCRLQYQ